MAKNQNEYKRLPGRGSTAGSSFAVGGGSSRLFFGNDHLLRVNSTGWTESYRRFYFADIQGISVSLTSVRLIWNIVHAVLCAGLLLWLLEVEDTAWRITLGCIALFFAAMFLINTLLGPTCRTRIQTRISTEPLPSLKRLSKARKVIGMLKERIDSVQGQYSTFATHSQP